MAWGVAMMRMWSRVSRADGADYAFAVGVHLGCVWGAEEDVGVLGGEDGVEGGGVLRVPVAEQEPGPSAASAGLVVNSRACWTSHCPVGFSSVRRRTSFLTAVDEGGRPTWVRRLFVMEAETRRKLTARVQRQRRPSPDVTTGCGTGRFLDAPSPTATRLRSLVSWRGRWRAVARTAGGRRQFAE